MESLKKQIIQDPVGRGCYNGDQNYIANHTDETTFDVTKGINEFLSYKRLEKPVKFATLEDAMDYINELGATPGTIAYKPYYSVNRVESCAFQNIGFFSVKE